MKRTLLLWATLMALAMPALMEAQLVTVTASNINDGGQLLPTGTICFAPVGAPATGYHIGSTGQSGAGICRDVATGVIMTTLNGVVIGPMMVADTLLSAPVNLCYNVTVRDSAGNYIIGATSAQRTGYGCVQPTANNSWCSGGICNFDNYIPNISPGTLGVSIATLTVGDLAATTATITNLNVTSCTGCSGSLPTGSGNEILATPADGSSGQAALRAMVVADVPALPESKITNLTSDLASKLAAALLGADNGVAPLDANALLPDANAPTGPLGEVLIGQGPGVAAAFADPLVQGTQAAGSSTEPNPVMAGVWDGSNLRALLADTSGRPYVNVNGSIAVTGTFWQATQPVSIATMPTTPVTGTFWQATQPVSGTFWQTTQPVSSTQWPAALDGSGFLKTHEQGTANVSVQNSSIAVTGTFWQSTQPVSGTFWQSTQPVSIATMPTTPVTGTFWQATQPVSGTFWQGTQPVSISGNQAVNLAQVGGSSTSTAATGVQEVGIVGNAGAAVDQAPGSASPTNAVQTCGTDGTNCVVPFIDPCQRGAKTYVSINLTANTKLVSGTSGKKIYVCDIVLTAAVAIYAALVEGTGTTCGTSTAGVGGFGGSTAATGWTLAGGGGIVLGDGGFSVGAEGTAADDMCLLVSAATQVSGGLSYVAY